MQCSLDIGNAAVDLAYLDPKEARQMEFKTEYFFIKREKLENSLENAAHYKYDSFVNCHSDDKE